MMNLNKKRFISLIDTSNEGWWLMTSDNKVTYYNSSFYEQFDINPSESGLEEWLDLVHPEEKAQFNRNIDLHKNHGFEGQRFDSRYRVLKNDGTYIWIESSGLINHDEFGAYMIGNHKDITRQVNTEQLVYQLAYEDRRSKLPNHEKLLLDIENRTKDVVLIHLHIPDIKSRINQYGELVIDEILERTISSLTVFEEVQGRCYRSAVDTFSILVKVKLPDKLLGNLCQAFLRKFKTLNYKDNALHHQKVYLGAYRCSDIHQATRSIISMASKTCEYVYLNEEKGWAICSDTINSKIERYFFIEKTLRKAIEHNEIEIELQPIVDAMNQKLVSFEALARWYSPKYGTIYPNEFIDSAERNGLIQLLGEKILSQASAFLQKYNKNRCQNVSINVNVSVLQLFDIHFASRAKEIVESNGISPENVVLELTESVLLEHNKSVSEQLSLLKKLGFKLAMDDFGSGYSSIISFMRYNFNQLKIDRELVLAGFHESQPFEYLLLLSKHCIEQGVAITFEGIENKEIMSRYAQIDSNIQGFYISKPLSLRDAYNYAS